MKDIVRTLGYYGYDYDSTMVKKDENCKDECFQISKSKEIKNKSCSKSILNETYSCVFRRIWAVYPTFFL